MSEHNREVENKEKPRAVEKQWGDIPDDNFGYDSDEDRLKKRGLEDWELVENIPKSQRGVPAWFIAVIAVVLLVAVGLSFPFWGDREGYEREWVDWGFVGALAYIAFFGTFVYFMVGLYGSHHVGRLDSDKELDQILAESSREIKGDVDVQKSDKKGGDR